MNTPETPKPADLAEAIIHLKNSVSMSTWKLRPGQDVQLKPAEEVFHQEKAASCERAIRILEEIRDREMAPEPEAQEWIPKHGMDVLVDDSGFSTAGTPFHSGGWVWGTLIAEDPDKEHWLVSISDQQRLQWIPRQFIFQSFDAFAQTVVANRLKKGPSNAE